MTKQRNMARIMTSKKKKKIKMDLKDYEGYRYGPLKLERFGRIVSISSDWKPGQHEKFIQRLRDKRPQLKKEIDQKITQLLSLIEQFEPLELLSTVSAKNCFADPEEYSEITHQGRECYVEYAQSLVLSQKRKPRIKHATQQVIEQFNSLIAEVFNDVIWYFASEATEGRRSRIEEELRIGSVSRYLFVRGDSFREHHLEMMKDVFKDHDVFLKKHYGFNSNEVIVGIQNIEEQLNNNKERQTETISLLHGLHELFKEFLEKEGVDDFPSLEDCERRSLTKKYLAVPTVQEKKTKFDKLRNNIAKNTLEIILTKKTPKELLKLLSSSFGNNSSFVTFKSSQAWPTNDSIIYDRPLIEDGGKFYCFAPQVLFRNMGNILDGWIQQKDNTYYQGVYQKRRAEYLENKALEYLKNILPGAKAYGKLYYYIEESGKTNRVETDGLILYDENLFIIEAKAGSLSTSARRGGLKRMKKNIGELIDDAYQQALRTKQYIINTPEPSFEFKDRTKAVCIKDKDKFRNIYLLNITLQNLGQLSTQLNALKSLSLIRGKEWPWSVFINDLRVISELIEFPSEFLHFLQRRIRANDYPQFRTIDELDFLMFYFYEGLYFEGGALGNGHEYIPSGYTEDLDRYYDYLGGRVLNATRPRLKISKEYKDLITELESTGKHRFTKVTTTLLGLDRETQQAILDSLEKVKDASEKDGRDHDFTMYFKDIKMGLMFSVSVKRKHDFWIKIDRHCKLKMYQTRFDEWILITVDMREDGTRAFDFQIYNQKWNYDSIMEQQLERFKAVKMEKFRRTGQKIGRNDPCPCGSGLKYKKCCGK